MRIPPKLRPVTIPSSGATDRTQLDNIPCSAATIHAPLTNTGIVYIGDHQVTNASGSNPGIPLNPNDTLSNISIENLNHLYAAADTSNDKVRCLLT